MATDASAQLFTDDKGYLTHADADTWMDAKRQGKYPCSPRGDRAVDIQALWYQQLTCAAEMARYMGEDRKARQWEALAGKVRANFEHDFTTTLTPTAPLTSSSVPTPSMPMSWYPIPC